MKGSDFLFVYGTLMHEVSHEMAEFLQMHSKLYDEGYINGKLYDLGDYPGALLSHNPEDKVWGQIFQLDATEIVIPVLDEYEGYGPPYTSPYLFLRKKEMVTSKKKDMLQCWVYLYNGAVENHIFIQHGNYLDYLKNR